MTRFGKGDKLGNEQRDLTIEMLTNKRDKKKKNGRKQLSEERKEGSFILLEKSPVRSGFDSSFDAVKISLFPSARNRRFWRKTSISRFLEKCENADRLKLVEEREMKTQAMHTPRPQNGRRRSGADATARAPASATGAPCPAA